MLEEYVVRRIPLQYETDRRRVERFLGSHGLRYESDVETAFGVFDGDERLLGCGCAAGAILKCFAVEERLRGQNALGPLVSALMQDRFAAGRYDLFVVTRPKNIPLFVSCGFFEVAHTDAIALLENQPDGARLFAEQCVRKGDETKTVGAAVMNCDPFTKGHRYLIETAAAQCDVLYVFVVEEDRSAFPAEDRFRMVCEGTADLPNVRVRPSGHYMISAKTFPTYFLKADEDAAAIQCELDVTIFAQKIAPVLHVTRRFAGTEPLDPVTARYNASMRELLPRFGIEFVEVSRLCDGGGAISASRVRALWRDPETAAQALALVPPSTRSYLARRLPGRTRTE